MIVRKCRYCGYWFLKKQNETILKLGIDGVECPKCSAVDYYNDAYILVEKLYNIIEKMLEKINHENFVKVCATCLSVETGKDKKECRRVLEENDCNYEDAKKILKGEEQE